MSLEADTAGGHPSRLARRPRLPETSDVLVVRSPEGATRRAVPSREGRRKRGARRSATGGRHGRLWRRYTKLTRRLGDELEEPVRDRVMDIWRHSLGASVVEGRRFERTRFTRVRVAIAFLAGVGALQLGLWLAYDAQGIAALTSFANFVVVVLISMWMSAAYQNTRDFGWGHLRYTKGQAAWSFFIPLLNIYRPYRSLVGLHAASDPNLLPQVPRLVSDQGPANYRQAPTQRRVFERTFNDLRFPVGAFWGMYVAANVTEQFLGRGGWSPVVDLLNILVGGLAWFVVTSIEGRRDELERRTLALSHFGAKRARE